MYQSSPGLQASPGLQVRFFPFYLAWVDEAALPSIEKKALLYLHRRRSERPDDLFTRQQAFDQDAHLFGIFRRLPPVAVVEQEQNLVDAGANAAQRIRPFAQGGFSEIEIITLLVGLVPFSGLARMEPNVDARARAHQPARIEPRDV